MSDTIYGYRYSCARARAPRRNTQGDAFGELRSDQAWPRGRGSGAGAGVACGGAGTTPSVPDDAATVRPARDAELPRDSRIHGARRCPGIRRRPGAYVLPAAAGFLNPDAPSHAL